MTNRLLWSLCGGARVHVASEVNMRIIKNDTDTWSYHTCIFFITWQRYPSDSLLTRWRVTFLCPFPTIWWLILVMEWSCIAWVNQAPGVSKFGLVLHSPQNQQEQISSKCCSQVYQGGPFIFIHNFPGDHRWFRKKSCFCTSFCFVDIFRTDQYGLFL